MCCCQTIGLARLGMARTQFPLAHFTGLTGAEPSGMCPYCLPLQTPLTEVPTMAAVPATAGICPPLTRTSPIGCCSAPPGPWWGVTASRTRRRLALSPPVGGARRSPTHTLDLGAGSVAVAEALTRPQWANPWHYSVGLYYMEAVCGGSAPEEMLAKPCPF